MDCIIFHFLRPIRRWQYVFSLISTCYLLATYLLPAQYLPTTYVLSTYLLPITYLPKYLPATYLLPTYYQPTTYLLPICYLAAT